MTAFQLILMGVALAAVGILGYGVVLLRRLLQRAPPQRSRDDQGPSAMAPSELRPPPPEHPVAGLIEPEPTELVVGDVRAPAIRVTRLEALTGELGDEVHLPATTRSDFGAILQHAPSLALAGAVASSNLYRVVFSPAVQAGIESGSHSMVEAVGGGVRAIAKSTDSAKYQEHARLFQDMSLRASAVALAAWQVAALVTAQKFLADIDAKLADLSAGVHAIQSWLENKRRGQVEGGLEYLQQIARQIRDGRLTEADVHTLNNQIENIERATLQLVRATFADLDKLVMRIETVEASRTLSTDEVVADLVDLSTKTEHCMRLVLFACLQRLAAAQLKVSLPVDHSLVPVRIAGAKRDIERIGQQIWNVRELADQKARRMKATLQFEETDLSHRRAVLEATRGASQSIAGVQRPLLEAADRLSCQLQELDLERRRPLGLAVRLDDRGEVASVRSIGTAGEQS